MAYFCYLILINLHNSISNAHSFAFHFEGKTRVLADEMTCSRPCVVRGRAGMRASLDLVGRAVLCPWNRPLPLSIPSFPKDSGGTVRCLVLLRGGPQMQDGESNLRCKSYTTPWKLQTSPCTPSLESWWLHAKMLEGSLVDNTIMVLALKSIN